MQPTPKSAQNFTPFSRPEVFLPEMTGYGAGKRALDCALALALLILTLPLTLLAMALVKLTSRGPALYSQVRLGRDGKPFHIHKIRTMTADAETVSGAKWSTPGDSRITPVGRWLRKTHLDELPQLWNVLRGDMSMVGPRPERPEFVPQLVHALPYYKARLLVRPGVTGLAQVQLPPDTDLGSVRLKLAYDLHYVKTGSIVLDLKICWATAFHVVGVSFDRIARFFGFIHRGAIEAQYEVLLADSPPRKPRPSDHHPEILPMTGERQVVHS